MEMTCRLEVDALLDLCMLFSETCVDTVTLQICTYLVTHQDIYSTHEIQYNGNKTTTLLDVWVSGQSRRTVVSPQNQHVCPKTLADHPDWKTSRCLARRINATGLIARKRKWQRASTHMSSSFVSCMFLVVGSSKLPDWIYRWTC